MVDLTLSEEQQALRSAFAELFAKHSSIERVRAAEPLGFDQRLWAELVAIGAPVLGVPESAGGASATAVDLIVVAQEAGRRLAPAPLAEVIAASGALAAAGGRDGLIDEIAAGDLLPTLALSPPREGTVRLAPVGAVADALLVLAGDRLLLDRHRFDRQSGPRPHQDPVPNLGASPIADWDISDEAIVLCEGERARQIYAAAVSEWRLLTAAALTGLGQAALEIGVDYVRQRHAFGVPLGWFQAIQHRLAEVATATDGAELLVWEAAWARAENPERAPALATMAFLFAAQTAFDVCRASLQYHGGYGYTLEYDIQLFLRRAKAWPLAAGASNIMLAELSDAIYETAAEAS
jgi:alkylation response protein AidB-like acyl-CoA dehydrogenase